MESIGETLRRRREERKLSLEEVSTRTKIAVHYLEALEEDRYQMMPAQTYVTTFLRSYARMLDMDEEEALRIYREERREPGAKKEEKLWADEPEEERRSIPGRVYVVGLLVLIAAILAFYFLRG